MKRQYTDEHAQSSVNTKLPEIETWPNQYREYEIEIVMPEFTSVCPKTGLPDHGMLRTMVEFSETSPNNSEDYRP